MTALGVWTSWRIGAAAAVIMVGTMSGLAAASSHAVSMSGTPAGGTQQVVLTGSYASSRAVLNTYQYSAGSWHHLLTAPAEIGRNGLSDHHLEGDGTTPTGSYTFGSTMYGLSTIAPSRRYGYHHLVCGDYWSGTGSTYNQFVHVGCGAPGPGGGSVSEALWTQTVAYQHFAVINYNMNPVLAGRGSGIFLHDFTSSGVTAGCVALAPSVLGGVLGWLDPAQHPVIRIGTSAEVGPPPPPGAPAGEPVMADFNGDGKTDVAVWRPGNGTWYLRGISTTIWGVNGDVPVAADFNGDHKADLAVWRPSNGTWYIRGVGSYQYGLTGDKPVMGDFNGDGKADVAVWRSSNSTWYIRGIGTTVWGVNGDVPVAADFNGDGQADLAVWRPSNGTWYVRGVGSYQYGLTGDQPVMGDFNGDGKADVAVWRPSNGTWYIRGVGSFQYGLTGDKPVFGDFNGDRQADVTVWRPSNGTWYVRGFSTTSWGISGDIPV